MAKISSIQKNLKRMKQVLASAVKRAALKKVIRTGEESEQEEAMQQLHKMPRDTNPIRLRNRCRECGRPCGTYRKFGLCRIHLREAAMRGDVPGLKKASWQWETFK